MATDQEHVWRVFCGNNVQRKGITLPEAPPWRRFGGKIALAEPPPPPSAATAAEQPPSSEKAPPKLHLTARVIDLVNAAIALRRPMLVTGRPGTGKSSLARAIAYELDLGPVLRWPIYTRTTVQDGLYRYDAIGRLQEKKDLDQIGKYVRLGPLGTALIPRNRPRVLLIDEIDKSDVDFPNELLHVFEEGWFEIVELSRLRDEKNLRAIDVQVFDSEGSVRVQRGRVQCNEFPIVVMTSNAERDFPPAFLRRCIRVTMDPLDKEGLEKAIEAHFEKAPNLSTGEMTTWIKDFADRSKKDAIIATDQLLNAVHLLASNQTPTSQGDRDALLKSLLAELK